MCSCALFSFRKTPSSGGATRIAPFNARPRKKHGNSRRPPFSDGNTKPPRSPRSRGLGRGCGGPQRSDGNRVSPDRIPYPGAVLNPVEVRNFRSTGSIPQRDLAYRRVLACMPDSVTLRGAGPLGVTGSDFRNGATIPSHGTSRKEASRVRPVDREVPAAWPNSSPAGHLVRLYLEDAAEVLRVRCDALSTRDRHQIRQQSR